MTDKEKIYKFLELGGEIYLDNNDLGWDCGDYFGDNPEECPLRFGKNICRCLHDDGEKIEKMILKLPDFIYCLMAFPK